MTSKRAVDIPVNLFAPIQLPNGSVLGNRLAKAAMEEDLADRSQLPDGKLRKLYETWAKGGVGLIITGNVMVDGRALTGPGGVVLENEKDLDRFRGWAEAGQSHGAQVWMQLNHPGRQLYASMRQAALAPSAIAVDIPGMQSLFAKPRAMTEDDIAETIHRFARSASLAQNAGFNGVEIHAAHGYLLSQFLSPLVNKRQDRWGGSLNNRARLLIEILREVRQQVGKDFGIAVKLNAADFQRGGFDIGDAIEVIRMLNMERIDFVELSGGSYEAPAMQGQTRDGRALSREAYFLDFAELAVANADMPVMLTGGIRRRAVAEQVLAHGVSMVGMATALALRPDIPLLWREREAVASGLRPVTWKNRTLAAGAATSVVQRQLSRIADGRSPLAGVSPLWSFLMAQFHKALRAKAYRLWVKTRET